MKATKTHIRRPICCVYEGSLFGVAASRVFVAAAICRHGERRKRGKRRIKAAKMRIRRSGGVHAAIFVAYTAASRVSVAAAICRHGERRTGREIAFYGVLFRIRNADGGVDAAATENTDAVLLCRGRCVYVMPVAAGCRRYGEYRCCTIVPGSVRIRDALWRQVAAAAVFPFISPSGTAGPSRASRGA